MENDILHDLIERYLDGELPENERRDVETRMAADPAFRAEVELHRGLQEHLGDPGELRLRAALDKLRGDRMETPDAGPLRKTGMSFTLWRRYAAVAAALALLWAAWWWLRPRPAVPDTPPVAKQPENPLPPDTTAAPPQKTSPTETPRDLIAMADPADLVPNPSLEARLGGVRGGPADEAPLVEITRPGQHSVLLLKNGQVAMRLAGTVSADTLPANQPLVLQIYSNRPADWNAKRPLFTFPVPVEAVEPGTYRFDFRQTLRLKPGLYYWIVGQQGLPEDGGDVGMLWVGKTTVKV